MTMRAHLGVIVRRRRDYRVAFATEEGRRVRADLRRFCMEVAPTADPHEAVFAMGMQRVYRRIAAMTAPVAPDDDIFDQEEDEYER